MTVQNIEALELHSIHTFNVLGETHFPLAQVVADIARRHCPTFDAASISMKASSGGKYVSVTIEIYLETREQINNLYADFNGAPEIKLVY